MAGHEHEHHESPGTPLAQAVRLLRQRRQWSQRDLAQRAGLGLRTVIRVEGNEARDPALQSLTKIARAFRLHESELTIFTSPEHPPEWRSKSHEHRLLRRLWIALYRPRTTQIGEYETTMRTIQESLTNALQHPPLGMEDLAVAVNPRLDPLRPILRALAVNPDGMLLVVAPRVHEVSHEVRNSDRVLVWSESELRSAQARLPASVVAIVCVSWPGHRGTAHLQRSARTLGAQYHHHLVTPRTVHELAEAAGLLPHSHQDIPMNTAATDAEDAGSLRSEKTGKARIGVLQAFLREHANLWPETPTREIERLARLAHERGLPSTQASIAQAFYLARRRARQAALPEAQAAPEAPPAAAPGEAEALDAPEASGALAVAEVRPASAPGDEPAGLALPASAAAEALMADMATLQGMCDDAGAALALIRDTLSAMAPRIAKVFADGAEIDAMRAKLDRVQRAVSLAFGEDASAKTKD